MVTILYELLYVFTAASALLSTLANPVGFEKITFILFVFQLGITVLFVLFKNSSVTGRLISIGILFSVTVFILILSRYDAFLGKAAENLRLLWLLAFAVAAFILGELLAYVRVFGIIVSALSFAALIPFVFLKIEISKLTVVSVFLLVLLTIANETQRRWKKYGNTELKTHMVFIAPFIILIAILILASPSSSKPYKWPIVKTIYHKVNATIKDLKIRASIRKDEDYAEAVMGFSDEGNISGDVKKNRERVLAVIGIPRETDRLKIAGKNFSTFTGRGWIDDDTDTAPDSMYDTIGLLASISEYTDTPENYIHWEEMYFEYIQMNTSYVFTPQKSAVRKSKFPIYNYELINSGSDVLWPESRSYKTRYYMTYVLINTENEDFVEFLKEGSAPAKESYRDALSNFGLKKDPEYTYEKFEKHQEYIKDFYCKDVVLSDELRAYMDELLKDCDSDYEKLVRIRSMLKTMEYSPTPGEIPAYVTDETEFLDYFILKEQKGYCSFFATAFVLLARAEGIPARYVQGYSTPTYGNTSLYITSDMAHAWAEVYFDNAGWIAFDATPGYEGGSYWSSIEKKYDLPEFGVYEPKQETQDYNPIPELPEKEEDEDAFALRWYMIVIPAVSGLAIIALFFMIFRLRAVLRFKKLDHDKQFVIISKQIFTALKLLGLPIEEGETISEYKYRLSEDYDESRLSFMDDLERYLYSSGVESTNKKGVTENASLIRDRFLYELKHKALLKYIKYLLLYSFV